mmetsp:Transcript_6448/g.10485  ORF Transcript_6448/g.10485 Transcript_6448/m.10485 type:complete len:80 (-) Transcript_6448:781-1020(-)
MIAAPLAEVDIDLKKCACKLVKYCSVECQKDHRPSINSHARKGWLNYETRSCLRSLNSVIVANVRSVVCLCHLTLRNHI